MADFCPVEFDFRDSSSLYEYEASDLVEYIHSWPRFGISKEFPASLFIQNEDNDVDGSLPFTYLTGVFMWSFIFSSLLIIYILLLLAYNSHSSASDGRQTAEARIEDVDINQSQHRTREGEQFQLPKEQHQHSRFVDQGIPTSMANVDIPLQGFDDDGRDRNAQVYNQLDSEHILRHLQTMDSSATLPQSQFISPTVSKKRILEAYFESIMNTSTMLKLGLIDASEEEVRQQPNERHTRYATSNPSDIQRNKPRQRWTFSEVFAPPRQEDDDDSASQPPMKARTFDEDASTIASAARVHFSENNQIEFVPNMEDGNISPRTLATMLSGSDFDNQQVNRAIRSKHLHSAQQPVPDSCFQMLTLLSGFLLLLFAALLISDGLLPLGTQSEVMVEEWQTVLFSAIETEQIVNDVQDLHTSLHDRSGLLIKALDMSCPSVRPSLCTDVGDGYSCDVRGIPFYEDWEMLLDIGIQPTNITTRSQRTYNWTLANNDLTYLTTMSFETTLNIWQWILSAVGIFNAILFFLVLLILWAVAIPKRQHEIQNIFVRKSRAFIWLFWISTLMIWGFAIMSTAGTFVLSDFCFQSPGENTIELMFGNKTQAEHSFLSKEFWSYHIDGCPMEQYPSSLQEEIENWTSLLGPTVDLHDALQRMPVTQFELMCGPGSRRFNNDLKLATSHLQSEICSLVQTLTSLRRVLECRRWSPQFESIIYQSVCELGTQEVGWTAMSQWIIVVMSLTIWTFQETFRSSTNRETLPRSNNGRLQQRQHKKRFQDDRLGKFPEIPAGSTEARFVGKDQPPSISQAPTFESHTSNVSESAMSQFQDEPVDETKRARMDPSEVIPTVVHRNDIMTIGVEGQLYLQSFSDLSSVTQNQAVENSEQDGRFSPKKASVVPLHALNDTLAIPKPPSTKKNRGVELAAISRFTIAGDSSEDDEEDLESL